MLHIRVVTPPALTERLVARLRSDAGVSKLVILPGAAVLPAGDAVQFDIARAAANPLLAYMRDAGLDQDSPIMLEIVDAALGGPARRVASRATYHGERAPVWELVEAKITEDASYPPSFFALLVFAGLIGACGILTNSQILIVGAMVVGPEYSGIIAVALGIEKRDWPAVSRGLQALAAGFLLAIVVTFVFALCIRGLGHAPAQYLSGVRPVSDLINSPNLFSVVVAVIAGIVGVVSLTLARAGALIGVFISITMIPAAADVGVSMAFSSWPEARGSAVQLLLNVSVLIVVGAMALRAQRYIWRKWTKAARPAA
jgi:uncharacterized hydrophobic protein (TIGR00271 family)